MGEKERTREEGREGRKATLYKPVKYRWIDK